MVYLLFALIVILGFCAFFLYSPLKISVEYREQKVSLTFRCLFVKIKINDSHFKSKKKGAATQENKRDSLGAFDRIKNFRKSYDGVKDIFVEILNLVRHKAEFSDIFVRVRYGTGEAAITGMIYGSIWAFVGSVYSLLCRFFKVEFPTIELEPVFDDKAFEIEAEGIITTKPVHIITAVFRSFKLYLKHKKQKGAE